VTPVTANFKWQVPQWLVSIYGDQYHVPWVEIVRAKPGDWNYNPDLDDAFKYDPKNPNIHASYTYSPVRYLAAVRDGKIRFDTPEMADFVRNMSMIFPKHAVSDFFVIGDPYPPFLTQQAAIMCNGTWALPTLINDLKELSPERLEELGIKSDDIKTFEWGTFENPPIETDLIKGPVRSVESATGEYLSIIDKEQQQTELALDFLMFFTAKPGYQTWIDASAALPGYAPGGPPKIRGVSEPAQIQKMFSDIKFLGNAEANYNNFMTWGSPNVSQTSLQLYQQALEGKITPEEFATQFQALVEAALPDTLETLGWTNDTLDNPARQPGT
jgi:ABC-type glycerol-3-phosphate transport system substrate-binding protein